MFKFIDAEKTSFPIAFMCHRLGVSKAGYPFTEELPIFLLIFAVPAAVAIVMKWKFL